jgi:hypothetical protein
MILGDSSLKEGKNENFSDEFDKKAVIFRYYIE